MVSLKKYNYFTGEISCVARGVSDIVNFFDLAGSNYILITPPKPQSSNKIHDLCLFHYLNNKLIISSFDDFVDKITNSSNFFRVDIIVIDMWSINKSLIWKYLEKIEKLNLPIIIVAKEFHYKSNDDVNEFHIRTEYKEMYKSEVWINDKINNTSSTTESLKLAYIRDKKLEYLFEKKK
jgi:hypothetical protein